MQKNGLYPASKTFTNVTLPAVNPDPPALRTSPAILPESLVIQGAALDAEKALWNLVSSCSSQRSFP